MEDGHDTRLISCGLGGRFREQYYWDSFWIVEGLIESELFDIANDTLQNFMDELDTIGFIPNGGRIYCTRVLTRMHFLISPFPLDLDRSQPPLFIQVYKSTSPNCSSIHTSKDVGALYHSKRRYQHSHSCFTFSRGEECRFPFPILSPKMTHRKSSNGGMITDP